MELEGFYYDPGKKKYFRITDDMDKFHPFINKSKSSPAKIVSIPKAVIMQEINENNDLQNSFISARLSQMKSVTCDDLNLIDYQGIQMSNVDCEYLLGQPESNNIFCVWSENNGHGTILQRVKLQMDHEKNKLNWSNCTFINAFPPGVSVKDLSIVKCNNNNSRISTIMCLTNHYRTRPPTYSSLGVYFLNEHHGLGSAEDFASNYEFNELLFSCSCHSLHTLAIGGTDFIRLFTPVEDLNEHTLLKVKGSVTSLEFSDDGNCLFGGLNNGQIVYFDVRVKKQVNSCDFKSKTVSYIKILRDGRQLIVAFHDNKILRIDNRNVKRPVTSYLGHFNFSRKIPLSVDENLDVLCSSGQDYHVRFWRISTGKLLLDIHPPSINFNNPVTDKFTLNQSWFSSSWKCLNGKPKPLLFTCMRNRLTSYYDYN